MARKSLDSKGYYGNCLDLLCSPEGYVCWQCNRHHKQLCKMQEVGGGAGSAALRERLVAYVRAIAPEPEARSGVWVEHSYARAGCGGAGGAGARVRVLLAPPVPSAGDSPVDVVGDGEDARSSLCPLDDPFCVDKYDDDDIESDSADDVTDWEDKVKSMAPTPAQARLVEAIVRVLRDVRLVRAAGGKGGAGREAVSRGAMRVRRALAPLWAAGPAPARPSTWLHAALVQNLPRSLRALYLAVLADLRRDVPRLYDRLLHHHQRPAPVVDLPDPLLSLETPSPVGAERGPWLAFVRSGCEAEDSRWERRLRAVLHVRMLPPTPAPHSLPPPAHCTAAAAAVRTALADLLLEAESVPVVLCGAGAGAALCAAVWGAGAGSGGGTGGRVRGVALLAPPLLTAEGPRSTPDDPVYQMEVPVLTVTGGGGAACWVGAGAAIAGRAGGPERRAVVVAGADDALRVPARTRAALRLPQLAIDLTVAEEVARFATEVCERECVPAHPPPPAATAPAPSPFAAHGRAYTERAVDDHEEYAHLPPARALPAAHTASSAAHSANAVCISAPARSPAPSPAPLVLDESGVSVVSRVCGGTPLVLQRPTASSAATPATPADILRMPIVFADDTQSHDEALETPPPPEPPAADALLAAHASGASGGVKYTRVIVAKRAGVTSVATGSVASGATSGAGVSPLVLRRPLRVLPRSPR